MNTTIKNPWLDFLPKTPKYQKGGIAKTKQQQEIGLNNPIYDTMQFPIKGENVFRGLDNFQPVKIIDESGKVKTLIGPNDKDTFKGNVREQRISPYSPSYSEYFQKGGQLPPIYTNDPKDPRLQAYNDSLDAYNKVVKWNDAQKAWNAGHTEKDNPGGLQVDAIYATRAIGANELNYNVNNYSDRISRDREELNPKRQVKYKPWTHPQQDIQQLPLSQPNQLLIDIPQPSQMQPMYPDKANYNNGVMDDYHRNSGMYQQGGQTDPSLDYLEQGEGSSNIPHQKQRQFKGRVHNKIDRSIYSPHPVVPHYQVGGTNLWEANPTDWADSITSSLISRGYKWPKNTFNPYTDDQEFGATEINKHFNDIGYHVFPIGIENQGVDVNGETQKNFFIEQMYRNKERLSDQALQNAFPKKQMGGDYNPYQANIDHLNHIQVDPTSQSIRNYQGIPSQHINPSPLENMSGQERFQHDVQRDYKLSDRGLNPDGSNKPLTNLSQNKTFQNFADNIVFPTANMAGYEGLGNLVKAGTKRLVSEFVAKQAEKQAMQEAIPYSQNFPASYTKANPTAVPNSPILNSAPELTKEQEILKGHGLDPYKTRIPNKKSVDIHPDIKEDALDRSEYLLDEQLPKGQEKSFTATLRMLKTTKSKPNNLITPFDRDLLNAFDNREPTLDMITNYSKNKFGGSPNWLNKY